MIDVTLGKEGRGTMQKAEFSGSIAEITADLICEISMVYGGLVKQSPLTAEAFKYYFLSSLTDEKLCNELIFTSVLADMLDANGSSHTIVIDSKKFARQAAEMFGSAEDEDSENQ